MNNEGKPLLVVVEGTDFQQMLRTGLDTIGGLSRLIDNNQDVLIKPNLMNNENYPVTSSPISAACLAQEVAQVTTGSVTVGDQPWQPSSSVNSAYEAALSGTGVAFIHFTNTCEVRQPDWSPLKSSYRVFEEVYHSPVIINFPCLKRHVLANMTTAVKNHVGTIASSNTTESRAIMHQYEGSDFRRELADVAGLVNSELTIVDARSILIGNGPSAQQEGAEIIDGVNKLIVSGDMVAVDAYCAQLLASYDPDFNVSHVGTTLYRAAELAMGENDLANVEVIETSTTGITDHSRVPDICVLYQNYPNPFNPSTTIDFRIEAKNRVRLTVYNSRGRQIAPLLDKEMTPGEYTVRFNGQRLASGPYFYHLKVGDRVLNRTMTLLK